MTRLRDRLVMRVAPDVHPRRDMLPSQCNMHRRWITPSCRIIVSELVVNSSLFIAVPALWGQNMSVRFLIFLFLSRTSNFIKTPPLVYLMGREPFTRQKKKKKYTYRNECLNSRKSAIFPLKVKISVKTGWAITALD